jgi:hypothetical protein
MNTVLMLSNARRRDRRDAQRAVIIIELVIAHSSASGQSRAEVGS